MTNQIELRIVILIWLVLAGVVLLKSLNRMNSSGLTIFYIINLSLIHFFGALIYLLPWYSYGDIDTTLRGLRVATYGIISFSVGNLVLAPYLFNFFRIPLNNISCPQLLKEPQIHSASNLPKLYLLVGIIFYSILFTRVGRFPTLNALISVGQQLILIGVFLVCWKAWIEKDRKRLMTFLILSLIFPFITIVFQGFFGTGIGITIMIYSFAARFFDKKWKIVIPGIILAYLTLSFYQSYRRDRDEIRAAVWGGSPVIERVEELGNTLSDVEWFDPYNAEHLERINDRMNQNFLIGKGVDYLKLTKDYAYGKTLWESVIALIPRIMWSDKPVYAGSGEIVSRYTGLFFSSDTSVGVGQVMEFYINFGIPCVIIGFLILGTVIAFIDIKAGHNLLTGEWRKFAFWLLPGLALLNLGGSLVEVTSSAGAGIVVAYFVSRLRSRHYPVLSALIYLIFVVYVAKPYLEILILIVVAVVIIKKYISPTLRKVIRSLSHS